MLLSATQVGEYAQRVWGPGIASYWPWAVGLEAILGGWARGHPREERVLGQPGPACSISTRPAGDTYFFKGAHYWRFPKGTVKADPDSPQPMGPKWLDCPAPSAGPGDPRPPKATLKPGTCNCQCEINQAARRPSVPLLLPLVPLLVAGVASR